MRLCTHIPHDERLQSISEALNNRENPEIATETIVDLAELVGNLRWRRFRGDGDWTGKESLELRQPSLPVKNRTLRSQ